jgi:hypothetical protein
VDGGGNPVPPLFGWDPGVARAWLERQGVAVRERRCDDPRGRMRGPDVVLASRPLGEGTVELVVGATYGEPEGMA